jgi:indole-3-glycerol phosphate synthase
MAGGVDFLGPILERKRREIARRMRHRRSALGSEVGAGSEARAELAHAALRRAPHDPLRVIAEIKLRSPSAGEIRPRSRGLITEIARGYAAGGAAAISVLCDGPGFGGTPLDLRRAARSVAVPLLFKEFVLDPIQIALARASGAHMVLLLVRALPEAELEALVEHVLSAGLAPVVEAADEAELERALATRATIVGVNARDLRSFAVDPERARRALERVPRDRIAIHMSGITSAEALAHVAESRADAVLVGGALMRAPAPGERLRAWLQAANSTLRPG